MISPRVKNENFRCIFEQNRFFLAMGNIVFRTKFELVYSCKTVKKVSPEITISESMKFGREKLIFSRFMLKQLQIHDETKNRLNTLLHRLFGGLLEVPTKYYVKSKMICDYIN